jgi:hypothetical protein
MPEASALHPPHIGQQHSHNDAPKASTNSCSSDSALSDVKDVAPLLDTASLSAPSGRHTAKAPASEAFLNNKHDLDVLVRLPPDEQALVGLAERSLLAKHLVLHGYNMQLACSCLCILFTFVIPQVSSWCLVSSQCAVLIPWLPPVFHQVAT